MAMQCLTHPGKNVCFFGILVGYKLQSLDGARSSTDDQDLLPLGLFAVQLGRVVDFSFELLLAGDVGHLGVSAGSDGSDDTIKAAVGRVVDNPAAIVVLVDFLNAGVELGALLETIKLPKLGDLADDLPTIGISSTPLHGGMKTVHDAVDLQTRSIIHFLRIDQL